jgi:hypothetical protein
MKASEAQAAGMPIKGHIGGCVDYWCPKCQWTHDYTDGIAAIWNGQDCSICCGCYNSVFPCGKVFEAHGRKWKLEDRGRYLPKLVVPATEHPPSEETLKES